MLLSQACFNAAFLMFLLWILFYVRLLSRAVQVRQQQGNDRQQTSPATRQDRRSSEEHQNIEVVTNKKYPEEHDERPAQVSRFNFFISFTERTGEQFRLSNDWLISVNQQFQFLSFTKQKLDYPMLFKYGTSRALSVKYMAVFFNSIMFVNIPTSFLTDKNSADACSLEPIVSRQNSLVCLIIS